MSRSAYAVIALLLLLSAAAIYSLQLRIDMTRKGSTAAEEFMRLPKVEYLRVASLGYSNLVADLLWLKAVQNMGEKKVSPEGYEWIYKALDTVTSLDPKFVAPYEAGGLILTIVADKVELSNKLLEKGVENLPQYWQLPFYLGFNYLFYMKDYKKAAEYMEKAPKIPGSPEYLPLLTARLYLQSKDPAYALEFLMRMYDNTTDERLRERLAERITVARSDLIASRLQEAADLYRQRTGSAPRELGELIHAGLIGFVPEDPAGGMFVIDKDGRVKSTAIKGKTGVYTLQGG